MIKNIIFDLGNVLLDFEPEEYVKSKIEKGKVDEIYKSIFKSDEWLMLDRGIISEACAAQNIINRNIENKQLVDLVFENWYDILTPIESSVEILKKLKERGYKVFYLSNFHLAAFKIVTEKYEFFKWFEGGVVSYEEKLLKPEKEIYEKIIKRYNLNPEETLFIDDSKANTNAAMEHGLSVITLHNPIDLKEELQELKINI